MRKVLVVMGMCLLAFYIGSVLYRSRGACKWLPWLQRNKKAVCGIGYLPLEVRYIGYLQCIID